MRITARTLGASGRCSLLIAQGIQLTLRSHNIIFLIPEQNSLEPQKPYFVAMKNWLGLLLGILLPSFASGQAAKTFQLAENNIVVRFVESKTATDAREILTTAANARQELAEKLDRLAFTAPVEIRLSATTYEFCQMTGRPWWQASIYRDHVIYLQPLRVLRERGILATTLRHELVHQWVEEQSRGNSPRWLSEALAIYHSGEIALLKPARRKVNHTELQWQQLEKRLERTTNKAEAEQLYFQLYHLGQFIETKFSIEKIGLLLHRLGEKTPFAQACRELWGEEVETLEKNWFQYAREKLH